MVELRKVRIRGKWTYVEVSPAACENGHDVAPGWGMCPHCRKMERLWKCMEVCGAPVIHDCQYSG